MSTILLIEDDPARMIGLAMLLRSANHTVFEASGQDEAMRLCRDHGNAIHLLVMNVDFAGNQDGLLARRLLSVSPPMQALFLGTAKPDAVHRLGELPDRSAVVPAPFAADKFMRAVQIVLAGGPEGSFSESEP